MCSSCCACMNVLDLSCACALNCSVCLFVLLFTSLVLARTQETGVSSLLVVLFYILRPSVSSNSIDSVSHHVKELVLAAVLTSKFIPNHSVLVSDQSLSSALATLVTNVAEHALCFNFDPAKLCWAFLTKGRRRRTLKRHLYIPRMFIFTALVV